MRRWFVIPLIAVAVVVLWLYVGVSGVVSARTDLASRFDKVVQFYTAMDAQYVAPLLDNPDLAPGDRDALSAMAADLKRLAVAQGVDAQFALLIPIQKSVIAFFTSPNFPESFRADPRYLAWNKNSTKQGEASSVIKAYNEALSLYNARAHSSFGQVATWWSRWNYHQFLTIDGTLEDAPKISF